MMSLQEMSDRLEIQDLFSRYSYAIDERDYDALDNVFTPDAFIDYTEAGGEKGQLPEIKRWLATAMKRFPTFQHMVATQKLKLNGDTAESRIILFNPMVLGKDDGENHVFFVGLWYNDKLVRTDKGWRIAERREEVSYTFNTPQMAPAPAMNEVP